MEIIIEHEESVSKGRFFVDNDGKTLAEMTYSIAVRKRALLTIRRWTRHLVA